MRYEIPEPPKESPVQIIRKRIAFLVFMDDIKKYRLSLNVPLKPFDLQRVRDTPNGPEWY